MDNQKNLDFDFQFESKASEDPIAQAIDDLQQELDRAGIEADRLAIDRLSELIQAIGAMVTQLGESATEAGVSAAREVDIFVDRATEETGKTLDAIGTNPVLKQVAGWLHADWLLAFIGQVDVDKAYSAVRELQQAHPSETPPEIAHRVMWDKAVQAAGIGLASSMLPGFAIALFGVDLAATTVLQAETIYQIAAAYGLDLNQSARKAEVLAIFGLSLGGSGAVKAGLGIFRNIPIAGAAIGASTNAVLLYLLGYAACRFYEAKVNPLTSEVTAQTIARDSEAYLEKAIAQKEIMDRIFAEVLDARHPETSRSQLLRELELMEFTPRSIAVIEAQLDDPIHFDELLDRLDRDFAVPLVAQCYRTTAPSSAMTEAERQIVEEIAARFDLNLAQIREKLIKNRRS
ncbi:hypothetical protein JJD41_05625 [Oxynema sp. CENA135]|uniref:hypothetical protein n=1 Tax=Oxynema sp. CENA135 TaxID=984206 RepID=UPI001909DA74|nr:hypothetical protein [Oxynema sp. CENA135]MBK4729367.1 hypothetical protein [Oxynema sp. CENA135]